MGGGQRPDRETSQARRLRDLGRLEAQALQAGPLPDPLRYRHVPRLPRSTHLLRHLRAADRRGDLLAGLGLHRRRDRRRHPLAHAQHLDHVVDEEAPSPQAPPHGRRGPHGRRLGDMLRRGGRPGPRHCPRRLRHRLPPRPVPCHRVRRRQVGRPGGRHRRLGHDLPERLLPRPPEVPRSSSPLQGR